MPTKCSIHNCTKPSVSKGLCDTHRKRVARHGTPEQTRPADWGAKEKHPKYKAWCSLRRYHHNSIPEAWATDFWNFVTDTPDKPEGRATIQRPNPDAPWGVDNFYWKEPIVSAVKRSERAAYMREYSKKMRAANPDYHKNIYLKRHYGETFNAEKRIFLLSNEDIQEFYLWRAMPDGRGGYELKKANVTAAKKVGPRGHERDCCMEFDTTLMCSSGGHLYIIDEPWKFWGSRDWQATGDGVHFYQAQHGKVGDDVIITPQHTKQLDVALNRLVQEFWQMRNMSYLRVMMFRQPRKIKSYMYEEPPSGNRQQSLTTETINMSEAIKGPCQCYDTTKGVGMVGRTEGDTGVAAKGLPWYYVYPVGAAVVIVFWLFVTNGLKAATGGFTKAIKPTFSASSGTSTNTVQPEVTDTNKGFSRSVAESFISQVHRVTPGGQGGQELLRSNYPPTPEERIPEVTGLTFVGTKFKVYLDDGTDYEYGDGHLQNYNKRGAVIDGVLHRWKTKVGPEVKNPYLPRYGTFPGVDEKK